MFGNYFLFFLENKKNNGDHRKHKQFSNNTKIMFYMFLKTVLKSSSQKYEPIMSLVFDFDFYNWKLEYPCQEIEKKSMANRLDWLSYRAALSNLLCRADDENGD